MRRALALALLLALALSSAAFGQGRWGEAPAGLHSEVVATAQTTDSTITSPTNIAGLAIPVAANTQYFIECGLLALSTSISTAIRYGVTGPAAPTMVGIMVVTADTTVSVDSESFNAFGFVSAQNASLSTHHVNRISILLRNGANAGTVQITIDSEVAASLVTSEIGSFCEYQVL